MLAVGGPFRGRISLVHVIQHDNIGDHQLNNQILHLITLNLVNMDQCRIADRGNLGAIEGFERHLVGIQTWRRQSTRLH